MPTINCPYCNQTYDVEANVIGQKVQCAICNETFVAQQNTESSSQKEEHSSVQQKQVADEHETSKEKSKKVVEVNYPSKGNRKCPYCQKDVEANATTCPYCHHSFFSTNPVKNAIIGIIVFIVLYFIITKFVSCEAEREMNNLNMQIEHLGY